MSLSRNIIFSGLSGLLLPILSSTASTSLPSGSTNVTFGAFTQNATGVINRADEHYVEVESNGNGDVNYTEGWEEEETERELIATPQQYHQFTDWTISSTTKTTRSTANPHKLTIDNPYEIVANFTPKLTEHLTELGDLARYYGNLTEAQLEALDIADTDGDGLKGWEEILAGTDPTDAADHYSLRIDGKSVSVPDSKIDRSYSVEASTDLERWSRGDWKDGNGTNLVLKTFDLEDKRKYIRGKVRRNSN